MKPLRIQLAIIIALWVLAEGWFAYYWWSSEYFTQIYPSVGIPITVMAIVMIAWIFLRSYVNRLASKSIQGKVLGITFVLTSSVLSGFAPCLIGRMLVECDIMRSSFHGEAGWPAFISSLILWMLGAIFFLVCLLEILMKNNAKQLHAHD